MSGFIETPFKLMREETLCSAAATLCLLQLSKNGSQEKSLDDVCLAPQYGFTSSASLQPCGPRFVRITDIRGGNIDWKNVPYCDCPNLASYDLSPDDILVARSGSIGKSFLVISVPEPAVFASYMIRIRVKTGDLPLYVYWCLQSQQFWHQIMESRRGSAMKNINGKMLAALRFPFPPVPTQNAITRFLEIFKERLKGTDRQLPGLPPPLSHVRWIVARIEELAAKIEEARDLRRQTTKETETVIMSALNAVFSKTAEKSNTPVLDSVAEIIGGSSLPDTVIPTEAGNDVLLIKVSDMNSLGNELFIHTSAAGLNKDSSLLRMLRILPTHSIVFPKRGGAIATNKKRILAKPAGLDPNLMGVYVRDNKQLDPWYLFYWFLSIDLASFQDGTSVPQINKNNLAPLRIPLPSLPEQRRTVAYLDGLQAKLNTLRRVQAETTAELDAMLPSILDKAFKGAL